MRTTSAATNSTGVATFSVTSGKGTYTLTVTGITRSGDSFDPAHSVLSQSIRR